MLYHYKQLQNGRWGIFINDELVASIGCIDTCKRMLQFLENRLSDRELPMSGVKESHIVAPYFHDLKLRP